MHTVAEGQSVELQVRSDEQGEHARQAYRRMGLRTKRKRAKGTVYEAAKEGYELMYTECMVVRSRLEPECGVERYDSEGVPGNVLDEMAAVMHVTTNTGAMARKTAKVRRHAGNKK